MRPDFPSHELRQPEPTRQGSGLSYPSDGSFHPTSALPNVRCPNPIAPWTLSGRLPPGFRHRLVNVVDMHVAPSRLARTR